ncbi:hypothetical protein E2C01_046517 [Portunus trituberculatus]|uniref:Integrase catalytic domain-containing protein n=1 Tax=Portunus trituberculatus TaxID=210409 RepID=A0A5B7G182_PORTR|nr:hypothetical protein [Portunus trituberculatus]
MVMGVTHQIVADRLHKCRRKQMRDVLLVLSWRGKPHTPRPKPNLGCPDDESAFAGTNDLAIYYSIVAACDQSTIMALPTKIGSCTLSLAMDTATTVNVLSEDSFRAIKQYFHGKAQKKMEAKFFWLFQKFSFQSFYNLCKIILQLDIQVSTKFWLLSVMHTIGFIDNGIEFRNALLTEICAKYNIKQTFTIAYHLSSDLVERANRKILEALHHVVTSFTTTGKTGSLRLWIA